MKMTKTKIALISTAVFIMVLSSSAHGASVEDEISLLREQLQALTSRLDQLESDNQDLKTQNADLAATNRQQADDAKALNEKTEATLAQAEDQLDAMSWAERISWKGDFRYRYENIAVEDIDDRSRSRIRARAALIADVTDNVEVGIGIASGSDDPVSSNQTLGGGGTSKDLKLDLAYFDWDGLQNTHVLGGKFKNQLIPSGKNSMLWDQDWRPEGTAIVWDNGTFFANGVGTWLESDSKAGDSFAWIAEAGIKWQFGETGKLRAGIGAHKFDAKGRQSFFDDDDFFGNSSVTIGEGPNAVEVYKYDYEGIQLFAEVGFEMFNMPTMVFADWVENQDAPEFNNGWILGARLGGTKTRGDWEAAIAYEDLEADAALGLLVDSDFGGGGTDARGWILKGAYTIRKNFNAKATYFINQVNGDLGTERDFDRLMLDLNFKF